MPTTLMSMPVTVSSSIGETAIFIERQREKSKEILQTSTTLGFIAKGTFQQMDEVFEECSVEGWNGEQAKPIDKKVLDCAKSFLMTFPLGIEAPEVGAEPDGSITLEWYRSPSKVISISICPGGWLYFAAIIGSTKRHGVDFALFDVSNDILELILKVTETA